MCNCPVVIVTDRRFRGMGFNWSPTLVYFKISAMFEPLTNRKLSVGRLGNEEEGWLLCFAFHSWVGPKLKWLTLQVPETAFSGYSWRNCSSCFRFRFLHVLLSPTSCSITSPLLLLLRRLFAILSSSPFPHPYFPFLFVLPFLFCSWFIIYFLLLLLLYYLSFLSPNSSFSSSFIIL